MPDIATSEALSRDAELSAVLGAWNRGACTVILEGSAGVGKTWIARRLARAESKYRKVVWPALEAGGSRLDLLQSVARALRIRRMPAGESELLARIAEALQDSDSLLVADAAAHGTPHLSALLGDLVALAPVARFLVCSRLPVRIAGAVVVHISLPSQTEAVDYLAEQLRTANSTDAENKAALQRLSQLAGCMPEALQLVASHARRLGAAIAIEAFSRHEIELPALDQAIQLAVSALPNRAQRALSMLSIFESPTPLTVAVDFLRDEGGMNSIRSLISSSLCHLSVAGNGEPLLQLSEAVRARAHSWPWPADLRIEAARRHAEHFASQLRAPTYAISDTEQLRTSRSDLLSAWRWSMSNAPLCAAQIALSIDALLITEGDAAFHRRLLEQTMKGIATLADPPAHLRVRLLVARARVESLLGRFGQAKEWLTQASAECSAAGDAMALMQTQYLLCFVLTSLGDLPAAIACGEQALNIAREHLDYAAMAMCQQTLACAYMDLEALPRARELLDQATAAITLVTAPRIEAFVDANLALLEWKQGHREQAMALVASAQRKFECVGDQVHLAWILARQATWVAESADASLAEPALQRTLKKALQHGDIETELEVRCGLVVCALRAGDKVLATQRLAAVALVAGATDAVEWSKRRRQLGQRIAQQQSAVNHVLALDPAATRVVVDGRALNFERRGPLRRVLLALAQHQGRPLTASALREAGWPGERMGPDSASARVYMAIRRLRELGLESVLLTTEQGYQLSAQLELRWLPSV